MALEKQQSGSDSEQDLFEEAMNGVRRMESNIAPERQKPREAAAAAAAREEETHLTRQDVGGRKAGIQESVLRSLRAGRIPIEAQLDLHGYTQSEARNALEAFLGQSRAIDRQRAVRVIHGKGHGSADGRSLLREVVMDFVGHSDAVLAFCEAGPNDGGSGAMRVLLRRWT
jgi:DNA-nicking Smr family endonuclease